MYQKFPARRPTVAFLTDFGLRDGYVGVMKGVVSGITPDAQLIDITHEVEPQNVLAGAWVLATSYRYFPEKTVFVCVVDPGVGSVRRSVALHAGNWYFVGPDNGLFSYILAEQPLHEAVTLANPAYHLASMSSTFHGRDLFSPMGAHVAGGVALAELGDPVDPASLVRLNIAPPTQHGEQITAQVIHVDHFGNLITNIPLSMVPNMLEQPGIALIFPERNVRITERRRFFAGETPTTGEPPFIYGDSSGHVAVAIRNGNASQSLGINAGAQVTLVIAGK